MKAYIFDRVYIPGLGMGPFYTPVEVPDVRMVKTISAISSHYKFIFDEESIELPVNPPIIESIPEIEIPQIEEEIIEEDIIVNEPIVESEDEVKTLTEEELKELTVDELKDLLESNNIEFLYKDKKSTLISKYLNSVK